MPGTPFLELMLVSEYVKMLVSLSFKKFMSDAPHGLCRLVYEANHWFSENWIKVPSF